MNWRTCSSVRAKVDRKIPRLTAPIARSTATRNAIAGLPADWTLSPIVKAASGPMAGTSRLPSTNSVSTRTWIVAKNPNPRL